MLQGMDHGIVGLAEVGCGRDDRIEHGLQPGRRPADDVEDFAGRSLLLPRLGQLAPAGFKLLFQLTTGFAVVASARSRLRYLRTKTSNACSALRPFASQKSPRVNHQHPDTANPLALLRARRERPSGHAAAEKPDEFAPPHGDSPGPSEATSITGKGRASQQKRPLNVR